MGWISSDEDEINGPERDFAINSLPKGKKRLTSEVCFKLSFYILFSSHVYLSTCAGRSKVPTPLYPHCGLVPCHSDRCMEYQLQRPSSCIAGYLGYHLWSYCPP